MDYAYDCVDTGYYAGYLSSYFTDDIELNYPSDGDYQQHGFFDELRSLIINYPDINILYFASANSGDVNDWGVEPGCDLFNTGLYNCFYVECILPDDCTMLFASLPHTVDQIVFAENFDTSHVTCMDFMFYNCGGLAVLDLSGIDTTNVQSTYGMFAECDNLTNVWADDSWLNGYDTWAYNSYEMFKGCKSLSGITYGWSIYGLGNTSGCYALIEESYTSSYPGFYGYFPGLFVWSGREDYPYGEIW